MIKLFERLSNKEDYIDEDYIDYFDLDDEEKEDANYSYPILRSKAINIAKENNTLKTDFCRNSNNKGISYLGFNTYKIEIIEKGNKIYWQFTVLDGHISWIENTDSSTTYYDGKLSDNDLKYLRCLIDVNTGEYIYFPNVKKYIKRTVRKTI